MSSSHHLPFFILLAIMLTSTRATINLEDIDLAAIQDRLISPVGMVNQFALQAETTGLGALGWVAIGLLWRLASTTFATGPIGSFLAGFGFLFSTQSLALTIIRSLFDMARDLSSRLSSPYTSLPLPSIQASEECFLVKGQVQR